MNGFNDHPSMYAGYGMFIAWHRLVQTGEESDREGMIAQRWLSRQRMIANATVAGLRGSAYPEFP
jgi:hypothetical protein